MMTGPEYQAMLADALERLKDMADPGARGEQVDEQDQAAIFAVLVDHQRLRAKHDK